MIGEKHQHGENAESMANAKAINETRLRIKEFFLPWNPNYLPSCFPFILANMNNAWKTIGNGFSYDGNVTHCVINYSLIFLSVLPYLIKTNKNKTNSNAWIFALIISLLVQMMNWFIFNAAGVSVIWCSMAGFNTMHILKSGREINTGSKMLFIISLLTAIAGIVYYAVTLPLITTWAHMIAVLLGIGLFYLFVPKNKKAKA